VLILAKRIWDFLIHRALLIESKGTWKLDHERLRVVPVGLNRGTCATAVELFPPIPSEIVAHARNVTGSWNSRPLTGEPKYHRRWVAGQGQPQFSTLKSEEHTAQIEKNLAKQIEDKFRDEGVNLLSSTTTFEMGINIGDLQRFFCGMHHRQALTMCSAWAELDEAKRRIPSA
jgi:hypothetical protein